jgi:hypothetical protein
MEKRIPLRSHYTTLDETLISWQRFVDGEDPLPPTNALTRERVLDQFNSLMKLVPAADPESGFWMKDSLTDLMAAIQDVFPIEPLDIQKHLRSLVDAEFDHPVLAPGSTIAYSPVPTITLNYPPSAGYVSNAYTYTVDSHGETQCIKTPNICIVYDSVTVPDLSCHESLYADEGDEALTGLCGGEESVRALLFGGALKEAFCVGTGEYYGTCDPLIPDSWGQLLAVDLLHTIYGANWVDYLGAPGVNKYET